MTVALSPTETAEKLGGQIPGAVIEARGDAIRLQPDALYKAVQFLKDSPDLAFDYLNFITPVDYYDYFEIVYMFTSLKHNHSIKLKVQCPREKPALPSLYELFRGADFQEREAYDLMGIVFEGHPNLKRIVLWETFQGHPLRKDYL
jgi:NADH/F420H2 dehydrogenase subunit C